MPPNSMSYVSGRCQDSRPQMMPEQDARASMKPDKGARNSPQRRQNQQTQSCGRGGLSARKEQRLALRVQENSRRLRPGRQRHCKSEVRNQLGRPKRSTRDKRRMNRVQVQSAFACSHHTQSPHAESTHSTSNGPTRLAGAKREVENDAPVEHADASPVGASATSSVHRHDVSHPPCALVLVLAQLSWAWRPSVSGRRNTPLGLGGLQSVYVVLTLPQLHGVMLGDARKG